MEMGLEKSMRFPESCRYCFTASEHKDLSARDTYVCHTKSILTLHLFSKSKKNGTFSHRAGSPASAASSAPIDPGPGPAAGREKAAQCPGGAGRAQARGRAAPSDPPFRAGFSAGMALFQKGHKTLGLMPPSQRKRFCSWSLTSRSTPHGAGHGLPSVQGGGI